ncbi:asparagine synthase (glutamine-hydrolyzing) [Christiangramia echinicola]|uniref:asparagine synthase (glutamine-hydrolyzing) n=1 Tax=Christiangramia echinicola TaxID=279359 RepID=A0A1H1L4I8_9FLAO|nr:asparagine synthase (glutamine-hydrolyzing) [Christiangramia echinicola]SDR69491.1 asparagine synthase (glutamine-hydrolysing) [Christiangramia echinicola]
MCGIAGIISENPRLEDLKKMLLMQFHRGPDNTGNYIDEGFSALGHNRLSIIDLSSEANQPFTDKTNRFHLTFNGEIYNYQELKSELKSKYSFNTSSDTEVLLASYTIWGRNCLEKFKGMFSFAIWDNKEKSLFAARDRFGVKPFYYSRRSEDFLFASEIKAIKAVRSENQPAKKVWANYFSYGSYGMPWETFYQDIYQLPAGHCLEFTDGKLEIHKWYNFEEKIAEQKNLLSFEDTKGIYFELLKKSVSLRFRADVPIAFNISGGIDSSLLLSLVNLYEDKKNINAYTFYTGDPNYDELPWVQAMVDQTRNPLKKVKLTPESSMELFLKISQHQDEPYGGIPTLAYSEIFRQAQQDGVKVLLDGQGMDEQWAGYDYYFRPEEATIQGLGKKSPFRKNVLSAELTKYTVKPEYPELFDNRLQNLQYRDLFYTKIPRALRFNDRISMAYSTELREPFLDHHLVEFAFSQPEKYKIRNGKQKYMLREILKEIAPEEIATSPKRALQTPQREWLGNDLKEMVRDYLDRFKKSGYSDWFDHNEIDKEWHKYLKGEQNSSFHIWQWINAAQLLTEK